MSTSQQLVLKLIKAHTASEIDNTASRAASVKSNKKSTNRKRKHNEIQGKIDNRVATEDDILKWHTNLILTTDRIMAKAVDKNSKSSKSNAAAFHKVAGRLEQSAKQKNEIELRNNENITSGCARSSTSILSQKQFVKIPTFNKERYEKERKEKKRMKLAVALEKLTKGSAVKNEKKKSKKTIFG